MEHCTVQPVPSIHNGTVFHEYTNRLRMFVLRSHRMMERRPSDLVSCIRISTVLKQDIQRFWLVLPDSHDDR